MIELFPRMISRYAFDSKASMRHETDLLNLAISTTNNSCYVTPDFPKCNIYKILDTKTHSYFMEFALSGYDRDSLKVSVDQNYLIVSSKTNPEKKENREYLYRGLARRDFSSRFYIGKNVEVKKAKFVDGLLTIELEKIIPDEQKPQVVSIE